MKKGLALIFVLLVVLPIMAAQKQSVDEITGFRNVKFGDNIRLNSDFAFYKFPFQDKAVDLGIFFNTKDNLFFEDFEFNSIQYHEIRKSAVKSIVLEFKGNSIEDINSFYNHFVKYYSKRYGLGNETKTKQNRKLNEYETANNITVFSTIWQGEKIKLEVCIDNTFIRTEVEGVEPYETHLYYGEIRIISK